jgi:cysteine desulfurase
MKLPKETEKKSNGKRCYFDWAASAPYIERHSAVPWGNPSSLHGEGKSAKAMLEKARQTCASVLKVPPDTLYFTSGGTESNSIPIFSSLMRKSNGLILSSLAEHSSVREGIETLEKMGKSTGSIPVDPDGRVTPGLFKEAFTQYENVRYAFCMSVNNETGAVTDIASIKDVIRKHAHAPVHLHCDLVQAAGKIPLDITGWEIDSASISAHKIGGPRGIGLLYLKKPIEVFYKGGGQENGIRGGTENINGAVQLAACLEELARDEAVKTNYENAKKRWEKLINAFSAMERCTIIPAGRKADSENFSPYILQAAFKDVPGEVMARALDDIDVAVSTGSACSSSSPERPVLSAMGVEEKLRIEGIRISQGYSTTDEEIDMLINAITEVLTFL